MSQEKGILAALFDFSFENFITSKLISLLYGLAMVVGALIALGIGLSGFSDSFIKGIGTIVVALLFFFIYVMYSRVVLEIMVVIFRIAENTGEMVRLGKKSSSGATATSNSTVRPSAPTPPSSAASPPTGGAKGGS